MHVHAYCHEIDMYHNWDSGLLVGYTWEKQEKCQQIYHTFIQHFILKPTH